MYFGNYGLQKTCLDKCIKFRVSEHCLKVNMLKGHKHCRNVPDSTFIMFFHHFEGNRVGKCLS